MLANVFVCGAFVNVLACVVVPAMLLESGELEIDGCVPSSGDALISEASNVPRVLLLLPPMRDFRERIGVGESDGAGGLSNNVSPTYGGVLLNPLGIGDRSRFPFGVPKLSSISSSTRK